MTRYQYRRIKVNTNPKVFAITLNWNGKKWLNDCLSSVLAMDYPNFEVVAVDNGSTDGSVDFIREKFHEVQVVETGRNLGYALGFNAGLQHAAAQGAEYFLIMNNDTVIDSQTLSALVKITGKSACSSVAPKSTKRSNVALST